jgi:hypothetical protein
MNDYIELGPDDVIRDGDEIQVDEFVKVVPELVGMPIRRSTASKFRRPRSTLIRDAAIEVLREWLFTPGDGVEVAMYELRKAIGVSIEQLRKGGDE